LLSDSDVCALGGGLTSCPKPSGRWLKGGGMVIARRIRKIRLQKSRSLAFTALDAGLTPHVLSMFEEAEAVPTWEDLENLAETLDVPTWKFFFDGPRQVVTPRLTPRLTLEELEHSHWLRARRSTAENGPWKRFKIMLRLTRR